MNQKTKAIIITGGLLVALILAVAIPNMVSARSNVSCAENLQRIENAKGKWAVDYSKTDSADIRWEDLKPYLGSEPHCPENGTYTLGNLNEHATCSLGGDKHSLK